MELYTTNMPSIDAIKQLVFIGLGMYFIYDVLLYFASKKLLEKGVNVD